MKIGFVFDDSLDTTDGIQQYMSSLWGWFIEQGHEVHYLVGETKRTDIPNVHSLSRNITVNFNGNRLSIPLWGSTKKIRALLAREQFDVLHVQVPYHPLLAGRIIKVASPKTKIVGTFHIAPYSKLAVIGTQLLGLWSRPSLKRFDTMVSVSPAAAELAQLAFKTDTPVLPNVFNYGRFAQGKPLRQYDDAVRTIVFLGRLVPRKGCQVLLKAIDRLHSSDVTNFRVVICGDGQLRAGLETYSREHNLHDIVEFVGRISEEDKPRYMASADISVFPSSAGESFGIVLLEAMAGGTAAVLGGDNPGYRSVLGTRPEQLFTPQNHELLAEKLAELLTNEPLRRAAAAWGAQASKQYDVPVVGKKLLQIYQTDRHSSSNTS